MYTVRVCECVREKIRFKTLNYGLVIGHFFLDYFSLTKVFVMKVTLMADRRINYHNQVPNPGFSNDLI
jgi:hypothetical protein